MNGRRKPKGLSRGQTWAWNPELSFVIAAQFGHVMLTQCSLQPAAGGEINHSTNLLFFSQTRPFFSDNGHLGHMTMEASGNPPKLSPAPLPCISWVTNMADGFNSGGGTVLFLCVVQATTAVLDSGAGRDHKTRLKNTKT